LEPPPNRARTAVLAGLPPTWGFSLSTGSERVVRRILLRSDLRGLWLALDGARERFLGGAIVELLDLLVILGFPYGAPLLIVNSPTQALRSLRPKTEIVPLPLTSSSPKASPSKADRIRSKVSLVAATLPGALMPTMRAATLTVSPQMSN